MATGSTAGHITGRRRHVTLLFSDLCGSTSLADATDPEELAELFDAVKGAADEVVRRHDGIANQFYGDGVLSAFGLIAPSEDDARRAIRAALELHDTVRNMGVRAFVPEGFAVRLHSGIHAGVIFTATGDEAEGRYVLVGEAVHLAARLCAAAGTDEILVSERTLRGCRAFFDVEEIGPVSLKGFARPEATYRVLGQSNVSTRFEARAAGGLTPFIGRQRELGLVYEAAARARGGNPEVLGILGGPGIGKTRFLHCLRDALSGGADRVLYGYCESYGTVAPLQPVQQALRQVFGVTELMAGPEAVVAITRWVEASHPDLAPVIPALLEVLGLAVQAPGEAPAYAEARAVEAVGQLFEALASEGLCVLIIDDWQWVDDASRRVMDGILTAVRNLPFLLLTGSRESDLTDPVMGRAPVVELPPLDQGETAEVIRRLLPTAPEVSVTERLQRRSGGNPLFLEELCRSLAEWAPSDHATGGGVVPPSLHALIEARVERLEPSQTDLVAASAVIGNVVSDSLLRALGFEPTPESLDALARSDLLYPGAAEGQLRFKHGLTRDVVYECVGLKRRRELHRSIAEVIEQRQVDGGPDAAEVLAYHFSGAGNHEKAARYAELAGDKAVAASSLYGAIHHYRTAMSALEKLGDSDELKRRWVSICLRWATACIYTPARDQIDVVARAAEYCRQLGDRVALAHTEYALGWIWHAIGDQQPAIEHFGRALEVAGELGQPLLVAQLHHSLGVSYGAAGRYAEAVEYIDRGVGSKRRLAAQTPPPLSAGSAYALGVKGLVLGDQGDFRAAESCYAEVVEMVRGSHHVIEASVLGLHVMVLLCQGHWAEAAETAERQRAVARRTNAPYAYAMGELMGAYAELHLEPRVELVDRLQRHADWMDARGIRLFQSFWCDAAVAEARLVIGDLEGARDYADRALRRAEQGDRFGEPAAYRTLAQCCVQGAAREGESPEAYLDRALAAARSRGSRWDEAVTQLATAKHRAASGDPASALVHCRRASGAFREMSMSWYATRADRLLGELAGS